MDSTAEATVAVEHLFPPIFKDLLGLASCGSFQEKKRRQDNNCDTPLGCLASRRPPTQQRQTACCSIRASSPKVGIASPLAPLSSSYSSQRSFGHHPWLRQTKTPAKNDTSTTTPTASCNQQAASSTQRSFCTLAHAAQARDTHQLTQDTQRETPNTLTKQPPRPTNQATSAFNAQDGTTLCHSRQTFSQSSRTTFLASYHPHRFFFFFFCLFFYFSPKPLTTRLSAYYKTTTS